MIKRLPRRLPPSAQSPAADRIERIALDLLDRRDALPHLLNALLPLELDHALRFHDPDDRAASRAALRADGRTPHLLPLSDLVLGNQQRNQLVGLVPAASRKRARC